MTHSRCHHFDSYTQGWFITDKYLYLLRQTHCHSDLLCSRNLVTCLAVYSLNRELTVFWSFCMQCAVLKGEGAADRMERVGFSRFSGCTDQLTGNRPGDKAERRSLSFFFFALKVIYGVWRHEEGK